MIKGNGPCNAAADGAPRRRARGRRLGARGRRRRTPPSRPARSRRARHERPAQRVAAVGGVRAVAPRALARARRLAARARRRDGAAQRPRPLHPPPGGRLDLGGAGPPTSRPAAPTRRTRSSTRPPTRSTGTRRSTTCPRGSSTCDRRPCSTTSLGLADDALISAQRMGWWISRAPQLEEDVALGQHRPRPARPGAHRCWPTPARSRAPAASEDDLAYLRDERDFRNVQLVERAADRLRRRHGPAAGLLDLAGRAVRRAARAAPTRPSPASPARRSRRSPTTVDHAHQWVLRLGDGTDESHARMQAALDAEWPYVDELFDGATVDAGLVADGVAVDPAHAARAGAGADRGRSSREATLTVPEVAPAVGGGRRGPAHRGSWATCSPRCSTSPAPTRG